MSKFEVRGANRGMLHIEKPSKKPDFTKCLEIEKEANGVTFAITEKRYGEHWDGIEVMITYDEMRDVVRFLSGFEPGAVVMD